MEKAAQQIERLQDIVGRLPKTVDGVPVVPGMKLYDGIGHHYVDPWVVTGFKVGRNGELTCLFGENGSFDAICTQYYSTREAAEAARTKT